MLKVEAQLDVKELTDVFNRLNSTLDGTTRDGIVSHALEVTAKAGTIIQGNAFTQRAKGKKFKPLSDVTVLLRRRGGGKKIVGDKASIDAKRKDQTPLIDTGALNLSLAGARHQDKVVRAEGKNIWFGGTSRKNAAVHQDGGTSVFKFGAAEEKKLEANVLKILPGKKANGRKGKNWNRLFFIWLGRLRKMVGKSFRIPARPIIVPFEQIPNGSDRLRQIFREELVAGLRKKFKG